MRLAEVRQVGAFALRQACAPDSAGEGISAIIRPSFRDVAPAAGPESILTGKVIDSGQPCAAHGFRNDRDRPW
jgi:hypothetical protein